MFYTEKHNIPGMLLLIDFATAFDSLSWSFMYKVLEFFKFGQNFIKWIKVFYKDIKSCVIINGHLSDWFNIHRGCRQGDPLSPYLFILCAEVLAVLIKQNKNINGIKVNTVEFLVSQYADDTSLLLDGTEQSLRNTMKVLKFYANISGLYINVEKTKAVWIGSMKHSNVNLCLDLGLHWENSNFKLLGVIFPKNLNKITEINYTPKIEEIKTLLSQWSRRIITPIGKNVIIKTLALSKINHLIISLPNPDLSIIKQIQNIFYNYLWGGKPDKIKRSTIIQDYNNGGIRVIDLETFMNALKITWLRRFITNNANYFELVKEICPVITKFDTFGSDYIKRRINTVHNLFWKDVFNAYIILAHLKQPKTWHEFLNWPIWYNHRLKIGGTSFCYQKYVETGILVVNDLMNRNGNFHTYDAFVDIYHVQTNFLQYHNIIHSIREVLDRLRFPHYAVKEDNPTRPLLIMLLTSSNKGCRNIYDSMLNKQTSPTAERKWVTELNLINVFNWKMVYELPFKITQDSKLQWFQFRINHRILGTNYLLSKMGLTNGNLCTFCARQPETLVHLFWECEMVQSFWNNIKNWINTKCFNIDTNWSKIDIILGSKTIQTALNNIILTAKYHIYQSKMRESAPNLNYFKKQIKILINTERYQAQKSLSLNKFHLLWNDFAHLCGDGD